MANVFVLPPNVGGIKRRLAGFENAYEHGLVCDGLVDDTAALEVVSLFTRPMTLVIPGPCRITSAVVLPDTMPVRFEANGAFTGTGTVTYTEWSGAATGPAGPAGVGLGVAVEDYGAVIDGTTDDTTAVQDAINALSAAGGGTLIFPAGTCRINGQLTIPVVGTNRPMQKPIHIIGMGSTWDGREPGAAVTTPNGGTILDMRYSGSYGKILTVGFGLLEIEGITFADGGGGTTPWIWTTNTTLHIHQCAFFGSKNGTACDQDVIILGGNTGIQHETTDPDDAFQGYGTVIRENFFDHVRRAVWGRIYCNSVVIRDNSIWRYAGSNLSDGAAIEIDNTNGNSSSSANVISGNLIECDGYVYGIALRGANFTRIIGNQVWDGGAQFVSPVHIVGGGSNEIFGDMQRPPVIEGSSGNVIFGAVNGQGRFGARHTTGQALQVVAPATPSTVDSAWLEWYPRSAAPNTRGGYMGYVSAGATALTLINEIGDLNLNAVAGSKIAPLKPVTLNQIPSTPAVGDVTIDGNTYQDAVLTLATGGGTWNVILSGGFAGQSLTVTVRNTSGGAITTTWAPGTGRAIRMAAWTDPANGNSRSITFILDGTTWREVSRTPADVPN